MMVFFLLVTLSAYAMDGIVCISVQNCKYYATGQVYHNMMVMGLLLVYRNIVGSMGLTIGITLVYMMGPTLGVLQYICLMGTSFCISHQII